VGTQTRVILRVVFDTTVVVSALVFTNGRLAWLRGHWAAGESVPLVSRATVAELTRVLSYPKFQLSSDDRRELLAEYLPYCEVVKVTTRCKLVCRDANDQPFLDLAQSGKADLLVSGDRDLLALAGETRFLIETPAAYRERVLGVDGGTSS
jgi:putative PIN family toxin of toxin-antitoxin system